ncbi:alkaline phosphatase family protein [Actinoplanes sp. N902-109]|uniref:alkaline phosphatase family protein n=1 Tax=Actinoplanes sp. (strain N902-109) TaxID=649831 RepID=UPI0003294F4A|nr:type I phosphodiesterase/nucleotide pyrophosphatase [Actinoplanes sp. N902-109]
MDVVAPAYGTGSLADLLPSVSAVLGVPGATDVLGLGGTLGEEVDRVAVLLVDGLGAYQVDEVTRHAPILAELNARTLTSGFPSTTPVSLATLGTGVPPGTHGILGFTVRKPDGGVLNHIQWAADPDPLRWQPAPTRFETAVAAGVPATLVTEPAFRGSGLTRACYRGATFVGAASYADRATAVLTALQQPGLVLSYVGDLDHHGHGSGVGSPEWVAAAVAVGELISRLVSSLPARSALVVTADHGQLNIPFGEARVDLSLSPELSNGIIGVAGEPRVRYLHTAPGAVDDVVAAYRGRLGATALVLRRDEAIDAGWYGPVPDEHRSRIGDVVVACLADTIVLASAFEPPSVGRLVAYHGSLTAIEMTVPLLSFVRPPH